MLAKTTTTLALASLCICAAACSSDDDDKTPADAAVKADNGTMDSAMADGPAVDAGAADGPLVDAGSADGPVADIAPADIGTPVNPLSGVWRERGEADDYISYLRIGDDGAGYYCVFDQKSGTPVSASEDGASLDQSVVELADDGESFTSTDEEEGFTSTYDRVGDDEYPECCQSEELEPEAEDYVCPIQYNDGTIVCNEPGDCPDEQSCNDENNCE